MARAAGPELPAAVAADRDRHGLVAVRVERLEHRAGGRERDLVLARPAAGEHGDPEAPRHGGGTVVVVSVVVVTSGGGALNLPTTIVTFAPGFACCPAGGSWLTTIPSSPSSVVSSCCTFTLNPDDSSWLRAVCS